MPRKQPLQLAVLISGGGRTLLNLIDQIAAGKLPARIALVIASRADAAGHYRARSAGIETVVVPRRRYPSDEAYSGALAAVLDRVPVDLVVLAGFMHLFRVPDAYAGRVINIHPGLLPAFGGKGLYGHRVHEAVLAAGAKESGCTVHFADNEYDHGPAILQRKVPVLPGDTADTLEHRVFFEECRAYPEAIRLIADERVRFKDGKAVMADEEDES